MPNENVENVVNEDVVNDVAVVDPTANAIATTPDVELEDVIKDAGFLPSLRFYSSMSAECKNGNKAVNTFGLLEDGDITDLGKSVELLPLAMRYTAIRWKEPIMVAHEFHTPEFTQIREDAESWTKSVKDGNMWGPEFLVWVPKAETFACLLFASPSARRESPKLGKIQKKGVGALLTPKHIKTAKNDWFIAAVTEQATLAGSSPDPKDTAKKILAFMSAKNSKPAVVEATTDTASDRG